MLPNAANYSRIVSNSHSVTRYDGEDATDSDFYISGTVQNGTLTFTIIRRMNNKQSIVKGEEFFQAMLDYFANKGTVIRRITGRWATGDEFSSNIDLFNLALCRDSQMTEIDAAITATFTGRWANTRGFCKVIIERALPVGWRGHYTEVVVHFEQ